MKLKLLTATVLLSFLAHLIWAQELQFTLKQCISHAFEKSPKIKEANLDLTNIEYEIQRNRSAIFPSISAYGNYKRYFDLPIFQLPGSFFGASEDVVAVPFGTNNTMEIGLYLRQPVLDLPLFKQARLANISRNLFLLKKKQTEEELIYEVAKQYFEVAKNLESQKIINVNMERLQKLLELITLQYENDFAKPTDVKNIELRIADLRLKAIKLRKGIATQIDALKLVIGMDQEEPLDLIIPQNSGVDTTDITSEKEPSALTPLRLLEKQEEVNQVLLNVTKSQRWPRLVLEGNYFGQYQQNRFDPFRSEDWNRTSWLGLALEVPLFQGMNKKATIQQKELIIERGRITQKQTKEYFKFEQKRTYEDYFYALEVLMAHEAKLDLLQELYDQTLLQYKEGNSPLLEVFNAEAELRQATIEQNQLFFDYRLAEVELMKAFGKLRMLLN